MNMNDVYQLMDKFEGSTLAELSLEMEGVKLSVKKACAVAPAVVATPANLVSATVASGKTGMESVIETSTQTSAQSAKEATKTITAPLVGTFYRAPGPGEKPFVEVGQQVRKGDVVAIIEAMKLMNEITATEDGVVEEIVIEDGVLVEYDEVLIRMS